MSTEAALRWRPTPVLSLSIAGAVVLAAAGLVFSRPDVVALGLPLALHAAFAVLRRPGRQVSVEFATAEDEVDDDSHRRITVHADIDADCDWVQVAVDQQGHRVGTAEVVSRARAVTATSLTQHSGPTRLLEVRARAVHSDGAWVGEASEPAVLEWNVPPRVRALRTLPTAAVLTGMHGTHEGSRVGQGGDFRDIHAFAPGDELRRVDWRATARLARRPGDLLVRRTDALSDSSVVIALDTADDLGETVALWGMDAPERSGITSLDLGREAAQSIADAAVRDGDRVAFHALEHGGRTVRSGAGKRHAARLRAVIAATGAGSDSTRYRRTPPIPHGSIVYVLSTFFDGAAADLATMWRASGHSVVAVDILPTPRTLRLEREKKLALRVLTAERQDVFTQLRGSGVDVVSWVQDEPDAALRSIVQRRRARR